ncbi:hypothetical protein [Spirosoma soli]
MKGCMVCYLYAKLAKDALLRRYLRDDPQVQIVNVRGIGYKLIV